MRAKITIKQILLSNNNWWKFYNKHRDRLRLSIVSCIVKLLSCKNIIRGYQQYVCPNPHCGHIKRIPHTCKCKACSSCGKKPPSCGYKNKIKPYLKRHGNTLRLLCLPNCGISSGSIETYSTRLVVSLPSV